MSETYIQKIIQDLKQLIIDSEELIKATADSTGEKIQELRKKLENAVQSARETCQRLEQTTKPQVERIDNIIRNHPYESIGMAFGIGFLIGLLFGRK